MPSRHHAIAGRSIRVPGRSGSTWRQPVTRIDTHGAAVFLAGDRVLKVKRAVKFPFLDYSTLDKRKAACEAELAVNRLFAPQIYRGVVADHPHGIGPALPSAARAKPVEWALEMRRFDENATLDRLADSGRIDDALADALGARGRCRASHGTTGRGSRDLDRCAGGIYRPERRGVSRISRPVPAGARLRTHHHEPQRASTSCSRCCASAAKWG